MCLTQVIKLLHKNYFLFLYSILHAPYDGLDRFFICTGCGTGNHLVALSEYVGMVTGLELNEGMLKKAKEKTAHLKNVTLMQGDVTDMPYPDGHFDAVCCNVVSAAAITMYLISSFTLCCQQPF